MIMITNHIDVIRKRLIMHQQHRRLTAHPLLIVQSHGDKSYDCYIMQYFEFSDAIAVYIDYRDGLGIQELEFITINSLPGDYFYFNDSKSKLNSISLDF